MTFTVRHGFWMALIEIDGFPFLKLVLIFHGELLVIARFPPFFWAEHIGWILLGNILLIGQSLLPSGNLT